jgi:REP element-mobilizing transposase RayT
MVRGNERKPLFLDDSDHQKYLKYLRLVREETPYTLYAFCLMKNHVHLLIHDDEQQLSQIMQSINTSYALHFNKKYDRVGHVFQGRYKSEVVENEPYFLSAVRYIHNNPVKAQLVRDPESYRWSSYRVYLRSDAPYADLIDCDKVMNLFSTDMEVARQDFIHFSKQESTDTLMEPWKEESAIITPGHELQFIHNYLMENRIGLNELKSKENKTARKELIRILKVNSILSVRQISELLSLDRNTIQRTK